MLNFLFTKVLFMSLAGGAAILLLRLLALFTRRAFSCRWNYYIWLLAVGILLFPLSMPSRSQSLVPARTAAVQQQVPAAAAAGAHDTAQQAAEDGAVTGAQNRISGQTVSQAENNGEAAEARPITGSFGQYGRRQCAPRALAWRQVLPAVALADRISVLLSVPSAPARPFWQENALPCCQPVRRTGGRACGSRGGAGHAPGRPAFGL